jgi:hypothetical protein
MSATNATEDHHMSEPANESSASSASDVTQRIRDLNEKIIEAAKGAGNSSLDAYEKALTSILDLENRIAGASQLEWVSAVAKAHTNFVTELTNTYTKAARSLLK